ncbi:MAG: hypothetical protein HZB23_15860 [Deltaproteobacteria bacterium]|nr:hypothetical protein [Deltaproteobacteria bacterium]
MARRIFFLSMLFWAFSPALAADEPLFLLNDACVRCHLTGERSGFENSVTAWREGVHFRADTACADCHGGDRYANLSMLKKGHLGKFGEGEIVPLCGRCHVSESEDFLRKTTGPVDAPRCRATCVTCHEHHRVEKSRAADLVTEKHCGSCHSFSKAKNVAEAVGLVDKAVAGIEKALAARKDAGLPVESAERELAAIQNGYARVFHSGTAKTLPGEIREKTLADLDRLALSLKAGSPGRWKVEGLVVTAFFGLVLYVIIRRMKALPDISKLTRRKP